MTERTAYALLIQAIFLAHYEEGAQQIEFDRTELIDAAGRLGIPLPKNLGYACIVAATGRASQKAFGNGRQRERNGSSVQLDTVDMRLLR